MAHQEPGKIARPQVHADAVGIQRLRWPYQFTATKPGTTPLGLEAAHRIRISPAEFDEVAAELGRTLDFVKVPKREKAEVLAAFAAHKDEVTAGYVAGR
jgi:hemoglobin